MQINELSKEELIAEFEKLSERVNELESQIAQTRENTLEVSKIIDEQYLHQDKKNSPFAAQYSKLKELFNNTNDLILTFSADGTFQFINNSVKEKLGYSQEHINSVKLFSLIHPEYYSSTKIAMERLAKGEQINQFDTALVAQNGKTIFLSGSISCNFESSELEYQAILHDITDTLRAESAQKLYYSIANLMIHGKDLDQLYTNIHNELKKIINAENFYVALIDDSDLIKFPYFVDECYGGVVKKTDRRKEKGLTEYVFKINKPVFFYEEDILDLAIKEKISISGPIPKVWLGVPLRLENKTNGLIAVQDYNNKNNFSIKDLELLDFISGQIALAIERKENEEKIISQTARLNAIFESSTHIIWSINRDLLLTSFNKNFAHSFYQHYGRKPVLNAKSNAHDINFKNKIPFSFWIDKYQEVFNGKNLNFEIKLNKMQGPPKWKEIYLNPIYLADGRIEEISGIAHDITEKKQSQLALQENEEKFRNIFESFQDIYFRCDLKGMINMISPSISELVGYSQDQVLGKNINDYYLYSSKTKSLIRDLIRVGSVRNFEATLVKNDAKLLTCICNIRFIYDKNKRPIEIEGVARDITKLKKATTDLLQAKIVAERSLKVKELFLANMSHEIRTPMNGIIGMIDLIGGTKLDKQQRNYIQVIKKSSETLLYILNDILDLSKIEAGKMQLKLAPANVKEVFNKLHSLFSQQAALQDIQLEYAIDPSVPAALEVDETRLLQILSNLTSNAVKFSECGDKINISLKKLDKPNYYKVEVSDSGIGIDKQDLEKLFNSFSQIDNSSTKAFGGTGLGLAISKELCKLMNGEIGVLSSLGEGSTFWFTFYAEEAEADSVVKEDMDEDFHIENFFGGATPKVLLVDDNMINRQVAGEILRRSGCEVDLADNGYQGIEKLKKQRYDLVFMDIQMPEMDGVTATGIIKEQNLHGDAPIVAMTAYSMKDDRLKFLQQGLDDYISKPIKARQLIEKVKCLVIEKKKDVITEVIETFDMPTNVESVECLLDEQKIINFEVIEQLKKFGGNEMVIHAMNDFQSETSTFLENCKKAIENQDWNEVKSILHTIKGNAGTLGIEQVSEHAAEMESNAKNKKFDALTIDFKKLELSFEDFSRNYKKMINF